jgi:hypothetical protein
MPESIQHSFKRYEIKFLLEPNVFDEFYPRIRERMQEDEYGTYPISNIYFDTPDYRLIRYSLEKPIYKEKFRLRSYGKISEDDFMFAEIKKKYKGIVYKRRVDLKGCDFEKLFGETEMPECDHQIRQEIIRFFHTYPNLEPKVYIGYDRIALAGTGQDESLRVTFDRNISYREENLFLWKDGPVHPVLTQEKIVMEVKVSHAVPMWLASLLSEYGIYKTSISKYGTYYNNYVAKELQERMKIIC